MFVMDTHDVMSVKVSVLCTVYNQEKYLRQCFDGFVMQKTNFAFEVIVHDDCSTDGSVSIIKEYRERYPTIFKTILQSENQFSKGGFALVHKIMLIEAQGDLIAFCEGDDYWTDPNKLQKQFDLMSSHPDCSICFHYVQTVNAEGFPMGVSSPRKYGFLWNKGIVGLENYLFELCYNDNFTYQLSSYMIKRDCLSEAIEKNLFNLKDFPYGDVPFQIAALLYGNGYCIPTFMSNYRDMSGGWTSNLMSKKQNQIELAKRELKSYADLDDFLGGKYHHLIKYRLLRNELRIESNLNERLLMQFKPKYWSLFKFMPIRALVSYFIRGCKRALLG